MSDQQELITNLQAAANALVKQGVKSEASYVLSPRIVIKYTDGPTPCGYMLAVLGHDPLPPGYILVDGQTIEQLVDYPDLQKVLQKHKLKSCQRNRRLCTII